MPAPDSQALHSAGAEGEARGGGLARTNQEALRMTWAPTYAGWGGAQPATEGGWQGGCKSAGGQGCGPPPHTHQLLREER